MAPDVQLDGFETLPEQDQGAIFTTLGALLNGFTTRDADALRDVYADDADWVNAFGTVCKGCDAIVEYLRGLFADGNFNAGELVAAPQSTLRRITDDVLTVSTHLQISGQKLVGGDAIDLRNNYSLRVLQRQADGRWLVVSEMYMDARQDKTYAGDEAN